VAQTAGGDRGWLGRVRAGLVALLGFFDDEPGWARLLILDAPLDGSVALDCTTQLYDVLARLLDGVGGEGGCVAGGAPMLVPALTGELVVGGVLSVIRSSLLEGDRAKLVELAPSLLEFIAVQYSHPAATGRPAHAGAQARAQRIARATELPIRATHRTTLVLRAIAQAPYSNNREVAQAAGLSDEGQASKLLSRLERRGVIENVGVGAERGEPNAWLLSASGRRALELLEDSLAAGVLRRRGTRSRGIV
jgi:hypothetical protein